LGEKGGCYSFSGIREGREGTSLISGKGGKRMAGLPVIERTVL